MNKNNVGNSKKNIVKHYKNIEILCSKKLVEQFNRNGPSTNFVQVVELSLKILRKNLEI